MIKTINRILILFFPIIFMTGCVTYYTPPPTGSRAKIGATDTGVFSSTVIFFLRDPMGCTKPQNLYNSMFNKNPAEIEANKLTTLSITKMNSGFGSQTFYVSFYPLPNKTYLASMKILKESNNKYVAKLELLMEENDDGEITYVPTTFWNRKFSGVLTESCTDSGEQLNLFKSKNLKSVFYS